MQGSKMVCHCLSNFFRCKEGFDVFFKIPLIKEGGEVSDDILHQLWYELADVAEAHRLKKATLTHLGFHNVCPLNENINVPARIFHINNHPVMNRMVHNDVTGIGQNGIVLGEGPENIGIKVKAVYP